MSTPMTVREVIAKLQDMDQDLPVVAFIRLEPEGTGVDFAILAAAVVTVKTNNDALGLPMGLNTLLVLGPKAEIAAILDAASNEER